jgi:hypothetical protein
MTTIAPSRTGARQSIGTPMLAFLEGTHDRWLEEARGALDPACQESAGIWLRWRAVEYLETGFKRRFEREREAVSSLHQHLTEAQIRHLWTGGELMVQLLDGLRHRIGLCQHTSRFSALAVSVVTALEYWCREVEASLGRVRWGEVPPESRRLFELITYDPMIQGE